VSVVAVVSGILLVAGTGFFVAGTVGMLRFPDLHSRLHSLTKADNVGLGLVVAALALRAEHPAVVLKLVAIWLLALVSSSTIAYLIANKAPHGRIEGERNGP
jgi:multicomponent Na+:H+ antiporter subunit G